MTILALISIHAPARGATSFYSRLCNSKYISIHAPARGATGVWGLSGRRCTDFNSRPCERGDGTYRGIMFNGAVFQFTPLREGRHSPSPREPLCCVFQFTPLREGRPLRWSSCPWPTISIHAPARGATFPASWDNINGKPISIHAPARGATH